MNKVGNTVHAIFERNGYLLFNLFGGDAGPLRDDFDVVVGDIGIGFHGELMERNSSPNEQDNGQRDDNKPVIQRKIDCATQHLLFHRILQHKRVGHDLCARARYRN